MLQASDLHIKTLLLCREKSPVARQLVRRWIAMLDEIKARPTLVFEVEAIAREIWRSAIEGYEEEDQAFIGEFKFPPFCQNGLADCISCWVTLVDVGQHDTQLTSEQIREGGQKFVPSAGAWIGGLLWIHSQLNIPDDANSLFGHIDARLKLSMSLSAEVCIRSEQWEQVGLHVVNNRTLPKTHRQKLKFDHEWMAYTE